MSLVARLEWMVLSSPHLYPLLREKLCSLVALSHRPLEHFEPFVSGPVGRNMTNGSTSQLRRTNQRVLVETPDFDGYPSLPLRTTWTTYNVVTRTLGPTFGTASAVGSG